MDEEVHKLFLDFIEETCNTDTFEKYKNRYDEIIKKYELEIKFKKIDNLVNSVLTDEIIKFKFDTEKQKENKNLKENNQKPIGHMDS